MLTGKPTLLHTYQTSAAILLGWMGKVSQALGGEAPTFAADQHQLLPLEKLDAWQALGKRYQALVEQGDRCTVVAVLYGPTGAGKSTIFRTLTGLEVPAGSDVRPVSYVPAAAVPKDLDPERIGKILAPYIPVRLVSPAQLADHHAPPEQLIWAPYEKTLAGGDLALVLVDLPDFNSVETANRVKADGLLKRAETVVFVAYDESYKDERVVEELARCCRLTAHLIYVFTKCSAQQAQKKWADLVSFAGHQEAFREKRTDGRALHEFLAGCRVFYSPRRETPVLEDLQPLDAAGPSLVSQLQGLDAARIVLQGLLEPALQVLTPCRELLDGIHHARQQLEEKLKETEDDCLREAQLPANTFPVGRMLEITHDEARKLRPWLVRTLAAPVDWMFYLPRLALGGLSKLIAALRQPGAGVKPLAEIERDRLADAAQRLINTWRERYASLNTPDGPLSAARAGTIRAQAGTQPIPPISAEWEDFVRQELRTWAGQHKLLCVFLATGSDLLALAGITVLGLDLVLLGGLGTATMGPLLAAHHLTVPTLLAAAKMGTATGALGVLGQFAQKWHLESLIAAASQEWLHLRSRQLAAFLSQGLRDPLLGNAWQERKNALRQVPEAECRQALETLDALARGEVNL